MKTNASVFTKPLLILGVFGVSAFTTYGAIMNGWILNSTPYQTRSATADAKLARLTNGSGATILDTVVANVKSKADENTSVAKYNEYIDVRLTAIDTLDNQVRAELGSDYEFLFQYIYPRILELKKSEDQTNSIMGKIKNALGVTTSSENAVANNAGIVNNGDTQTSTQTNTQTSTQTSVPQQTQTGSVTTSTTLSTSDKVGTTEENPKACLVFNTQYQARDQKLLKINKTYTKAEISTYKNTDSTNLVFDDSTWWATWGSLADSSIVCKVKYPVDAVCGSVAWTLVSYGGISSTTPNTCSVGKYAKTYKYNGGNQFEPYYDYLTENTNTSATILSEVMSTANYVYTCEWLNGWAKKECKTGKIKIEGECGTTYDSIYPSGLSTSPASSNNNSWICKWGIFKWTDSPSLIDGKNYKFQCTGVNWGGTASCDVIGASVPSKIDGKCGTIDGVSDHNIGIGNFSGWDSRGLEFVHAYVWSNYPTSSGDAQLCSIWAYGKDIAWVVKITDNDGTDGVYNWECYGKKSDGTIDPSNKASCSAKKLKLWSCGTLNGTKLAGTETIAVKASTIPGLYTGPYLKGSGNVLILRQYLPSVMNFTSPLLCKDGKTAVISDDHGTSGYYKWKCPGDYSGSGHSFLFNNWKDNNSESCQAERVTSL